MTNLLSANFYRLFKDRVFQICLVISAVIGLANPIYRHLTDPTIVMGAIESACFGMVSLSIGIMMAVLIGLSIGTEYTSGGLRNQVIASYSRLAIYLANLLTSFGATIMILAVYFGCYFLAAIPLFGFFEMPISILVYRIFTVTMMTFAYCSVFVLIAMLISSKAIGVVACLLCALGLLYMGGQFYMQLEEPEYITEAQIGSDEGTQMVETKNPHFLQADARKKVQFFCDMVPGGQAIQIASGHEINLYRLPLYSFILVLIGSAIGILLFQRKNLR